MKTPDQQMPAPPLSGRAGLDLLKASSEKVAGIRFVDFLKTPEGKEAMKLKKIILAGPPRSGKSCLRQGLKDTIRTIPDAPYPLFITGCPDGEGAWFQEAMNNNPALAARLKAEYKSKFTPAFVQRVSNSVKNLSGSALNFIDIGGMTTPENAEICKHANGAILLCGETAVKADAPAEWKTFFKNLGIPVIAEVYSDYLGKEDLVEGVGEDGVFRGSTHHLERGQTLTDRDTIKALADFILHLGEEKESMTILEIKEKVDSLMTDWQSQLPEVDIVLGGSLVSGLLVLDDETKMIDVDVRFLTDAPLTEELRKKIEEVTGLKYRKSISVGDWPIGQSEGEMIEGKIELPGLDLPLDVEGCLRNTKYVGWAKFYPEVLTKEELDAFLENKKRLRGDKNAYKLLKSEMRELVEKRCIERGLVVVLDQNKD